MAPTQSCRIAVKVIPNAPRNEVTGLLGDALRVKLHASPVDGRANKALCAFLADWLGLPGRAVSLVQGRNSQHKLIQLAGVDLATVQKKIDAAGART